MSCRCRWAAPELVRSWLPEDAQRCPAGLHDRQFERPERHSRCDRRHPQPAERAVRSEQLPSQGFFGAAITKGGDASNGDAYDPAGDAAPGGLQSELQPGRRLLPGRDPGRRRQRLGPCLRPRLLSRWTRVTRRPGTARASRGVGRGPLDQRSGQEIRCRPTTTCGTPTATRSPRASSRWWPNPARSVEANTGGDPALDYTGKTGGRASDRQCPDPFHRRLVDARASGLPTGTYYLQGHRQPRWDTNRRTGARETSSTAGASTRNVNAGGEHVPQLEVTAGGTASAQSLRGRLDGGLQQRGRAETSASTSPRSNPSVGKTLEIDLFDVGDVERRGHLVRGGSRRQRLWQPDLRLHRPTASATTRSRGTARGAGVMQSRPPWPTATTRSTMPG